MASEAARSSAEAASQNASNAAASVSSSTSSVWDRFSNWASENKAAVYTIAGVTLVVTGAGIYYYRSSAGDDEPRKSKKERRRAKKEAEGTPKSDESSTSGTSGALQRGVTKVFSHLAQRAATVESEEELPQVDESMVETLSEQERKTFAAQLKAAGNKAYSTKKYTEAIDLYSKAILCKPDPIFYSNRAACYNAMSQWEKVIEDTTAALALDSEYVKALNRRANAYEQATKYSEALLDYTASCIMDGFRNDASAQSVERLLKKVAEAKAKGIVSSREPKLPSSMFVTNYLQSFRTRPVPPELEDSVELSEESGKGQLRKGLSAISKKTAEGYDEASKSFEQSLELGELGEVEAYAYNMRGTFRYLKGDNKRALEDLTKSVELQPSLTQSYIKRASMHLEQGKSYQTCDRDQAAADFDKATDQNKDDPDIYYHRAQLQFILGEFQAAAKDYQKSIDIDKDFIFSHIQLGVTQYKMGSVASSMATFRRCRKNFPQVSDVYIYYGELLLDQQKYQEAIEQFEQATELEKQNKPMGMNVLPLINRALAVYQWKQDFEEAEALCQKALIIDPECDIAVSTMAQLLLQHGKVTEALKYFEQAAELGRTEGEIVNALSYAEATRTQLEVQEKYPQLASRLQQAGVGGLGGPGMR
ncbi:MAG: TOM (translocase of outer membrane) complex component [Chrysothrix sp. TS-e1954]|nr:MAG: TOM (translocase of outer membrane) complex component [Chrysothrix sp. TS-e1954]